MPDSWFCSTHGWGVVVLWLQPCSLGPHWQGQGDIQSASSLSGAQSPPLREQGAPWLSLVHSQAASCSVLGYFPAQRVLPSSQSRAGAGSPVDHDPVSLWDWPGEAHPFLSRHTVPFPERSFSTVQCFKKRLAKPPA